MPYKDKKKQQAYQSRWRRNRREKFIRDKVCEICGSKEFLEIHHRDPKIKISHSIWSWSKKRQNAELSKCDVLCRKCHQLIHNPRTTTHGTLTMYKNHKCRCEKCRKRNAEYEKKRRGCTKSPIMVSR